MFARTIGVAIVGGFLITTGSILYLLPYVPYCFQRRWNRFLVFILGRGGACATKLGQWAANRPDLFPEEICRALASLHTSAPSHSFYYTEKIFHRSYGGKKIEQVFESFDPVPVASGAIAQVYKATIRHNGELIQVAVKVRHPFVKDNILRDLSIIRKMALFLEYIPGLKWMSVQENLQTFANHMEQQLDMTVEARNLLKFSENFREFPNICFPRPFLELSAPEILVETFEEGIAVSEYITRKENLSLNKSEQFKNQIAGLGFTAFLKMVFVDNFVHADLHPGNVLVREKNKCAQIVLLDAGLITQLPKGDRQNFLDLFTTAVSGDGKRGAQLMIERARASPPPPEKQEYFQRRMQEIFDEVFSKRLSEVPIGRALLQVMSLCRHCQVKLDGNFSALLTGLIVVEGLARQLNADFDLVKETRPLLASDARVVQSYLKSKISSFWFLPKA